MLSRRSFGKSTASGLMALAISSVTIPLTGCSAVNSLEQWIPVALTAVSAIVKLLGPIVPAPVAAAIVLIQAAFSALLTTLQNYKAGSSVLQDISNAIAAVESAFASFFASLSIPSGLLNTIEGLASIILSTIEAFANEINPTTTVKSFAVAGSHISVTPQKRSVKSFRKDWNAMATQDGVPQAQI